MNIFWLLFVLVIISVSSLTHWYLFVAVLLGWWAVMLLTRCSFKKIFRKFIRLEPFFLILAAFSFFQDSTGVLFLNIFCKVTLSLLWILFFSSVVSLSQVMRDLKRISMPHVLVEIIALTIRYIEVILSELRRTDRARRARLACLSTRSIWTILSYTIARLYHRSSLRAHRVYQAMVCRGVV